MSEGVGRLGGAGVTSLALLHGLHQGQLKVEHVPLAPAHGLVAHDHHVLVDLLLHLVTRGDSQEESDSYQTSHLARGRFTCKSQVNDCKASSCLHTFPLCSDCRE